MLLTECAGFNYRAASEWETIKNGIEFLGSDQVLESSSTSYICFNPEEDCKLLALRCVRARGLTVLKSRLTHSRASVYFVFLDAQCISSEVRILDIMGGYLFRRSEDFRVIPTVSNHASFLKDVFKSLSHLQLPNHMLVPRVFKSQVEARDNFRLTLGICVLRDLVEVYRQDSREIPGDVERMIHEKVKILLDWGGEIRDSNLSSESFSRSLETIKPRVNPDLLEEWESTVLGMYNHRRPPERRKSERSQSVRSTERKARSRMQSYADMEIDDEIGEQEVKASSKSVLVVDNWLQCDKCANWRLVSSDQLKAFQNSFFQCSEIGKSCSDPGDDSQANSQV